MITSIEIANFKAFEKQPIPLGKLTLMAGLNGMGKSSALQVLLLLRQSYAQNLLETVGLALTGDLINIGTARDALCEGSPIDDISFTVTSEKANRHWTFAYDSPDSNVIPLKSASGSGPMHEEPIFTDNFQYLNAERLGPRVSFTMSEFAVRRHRNIGSHGEFAAHFLDVAREREVASELLMHPQAKSKNVSAQVEAWLGDVSPGTRVHLDARKELDLIGVQYSFAGEKAVTNQFRATNVGFGLTYVLPVIVALVAAQKGDLVLIENPEAHIHPRGQLRLGELMSLAAAAGVQVVTETHSDHVLNGIRLSVHQKALAPDAVKLHFFDRSSAQGPVRASVTTPSIDLNGRIDHWPAGFFDEWDRALEKLMMPSR